MVSQIDNETIKKHFRSLIAGGLNCRCDGLFARTYTLLIEEREKYQILDRRLDSAGKNNETLGNLLEKVQKERSNLYDLLESRTEDLKAARASLDQKDAELQRKDIECQQKKEQGREVLSEPKTSDCKNDVVELTKEEGREMDGLVEVFCTFLEEKSAQLEKKIRKAIEVFTWAQAGDLDEGFSHVLDVNLTKEEVQERCESRGRCFGRWTFKEGQDRFFEEGD